MIDDPLGLIVQGIFVLAAGMYPVGFLFGVCSDCCCPPCNLCTHYQNTDGLCPDLDAITEWTFEIGDYTPVTVAIGVDFSDIGIAVPLDDIPPVPECGGVSYDWTSATVNARLNDILPNIDSCGCGSCNYEVRLQLYLTFDNDGFAVYERTLTSTSPLNECADTGSSLAASSSWELVDEDPCNLAGTGAAILAWLNGLSVSGLYAIEPCVCGACCEGPGLDQAATCTDNLAQGGCSAGFSSFHQDTQCAEVDCSSGACCTPGGCVEVFTEAQCDWAYYDGVSCDPDPC